MIHYRTRHIVQALSLASSAALVAGVMAEQPSTLDAPIVPTSSSMYDPPAEQQETPPQRSGDIADPLSPAIREASLVAVQVPEPREFAVHDLVSIMVIESASNASDAELSTEKEAKIDAAIEAFIDLQALIEARLEPSVLAKGAPTVTTDFGHEFEGEGSQKRSDTLTTRLQCEIIDIKPNGNLVLEARKHIKMDKETISIILTGVCRAADIDSDNTIRSNMIHDLRIVKEHTGELRKATKKGLITNILETLFNF